VSRIIEAFRKSEVILVFCLLALFVSGCDEGIAPEEKVTIVKTKGIGGTIYFANWPPQDSVRDLRLVAFFSYPPGDIVDDVLNGRARYTDKLEPYGADSISYLLDMTTIYIDTLKFIAVGQQYGPNIQTDWRLVGVYFSGGDSSLPGIVVMHQDSVINGVNISVDFNKLPPLP
jgi:hypothetical protein